MRILGATALLLGLGLITIIGIAVVEEVIIRSRKRRLQQRKYGIFGCRGRVL